MIWLTTFFSRKDNSLHIYFPGAGFLVGAVFMLISSIIAYLVLKNDPIVKRQATKS
jgi:hypothetical protein